MRAWRRDGAERREKNACRFLVPGERSERGVSASERPGACVVVVVVRAWWWCASRVAIVALLARCARAIVALLARCAVLAWSHVKLHPPDWDSRIGRCVPMGNGRGLVAGGGKQRGVGKTQIVLKKRRIAEMFCVVVFCC